MHVTDLLQGDYEFKPDHPNRRLLLNIYGPGKTIGSDRPDITLAIRSMRELLSADAGDMIIKVGAELISVPEQRQQILSQITAQVFAPAMDWRIVAEALEAADLPLSYVAELEPICDDGDSRTIGRWLNALPPERFTEGSKALVTAILGWHRAHLALRASR